jgi:hypothetical protein
VESLINSLSGRSELEFQSMINTIDSSLWTIDPLGSRKDCNLTVLMGRPLALVRTKLRLSLNGNPITDVGWASTFKPPVPDYLSYRFGVRLGDQASREDGLIGYYIEKNYDQFYSVVSPKTEQTYVKQIGPVGSTVGNYLSLCFDLESEVNLTLLVDPRASIHAYTGILPVKELQIPAALVNKPLSNIKAAFQVTPLLTRVLSTSNKYTGYPYSVSYIPLAEQNGIWSWWEKSLQEDTSSTVTWKGYNLSDALLNADHKDGNLTLREGMLQLIADLEK